MSITRYINYLLVFGVFGILLLYVLNDYKQSLSGVDYKIYVEANTVYQTPLQGKYTADAKLVNYNPAYTIEYSTNGGKSFVEYNSEPIAKIRVHDITKYVTSIRHKHPYGDLPKMKSFLVRAKHQDNIYHSKVEQLTYFENYQSQLPIVSLIINEDDLFDTNDGMMILGENSWENKGFYQKFWDRNANYKQRKGKWRKKAFFQYFENGVLKDGLICEASIGGNATRAFEQKSIKLKLNRAYSSKQFEYPYFGKQGLKKYNSLVIRNSGNDNKKTLFADLLMQTLAIDGKLLTQKGKPVNVFLNGNYWGIYNLRERYDAYFIAKNEKVKEEKVTLLEGGSGEMKAGNKIVQQKYISFIDSLNNLNEVDDETIDLIRSRISTKSFINYIFNETFFGNGDWLHNNAMWYKADNKKWKWLLNDLDYGMAYTGSNNVSMNYFQTLKSSTTITAKLFNVLMKNPKFKKKFKKKLQKNLGKMYFDGRVDEIFESLKNQFEQNIEWQINRWRGNLSKETWEENCTNNLNYLHERQAIYLKHVKEL